MGYSILEYILDIEKENLEQKIPKKDQVASLTFSKVWKTFTDLAKTLDIYSVHLIKVHCYLF